MHLGGPVQVHMGHAPEGREPRRVRLDHLGHISVFMPHIGRQEPDARARKHRVLHRIGVGAFVDHVFFRHLLPDPFHERRTRVQIGHAAEPVVGDVLQPVQGPVAEDVILVRKQPHGQGSQLADDIVQVIARRTGAQRHMRLAVFQPQRAGVDDQLRTHLGVVGLIFGQRPRHQGRHLRQAGDDQLPRHGRAAPMDAARQLGQLVLGRARNGQQVFARLRRGVAARVALEQLGAQLALKAVNVADDGGMVDA